MEVGTGEHNNPAFPVTFTTGATVASQVAYCLYRIGKNSTCAVCKYITLYTLKRSSIALYGNLSQSYGASLAIWDHTVLLACTRHM